MNDEEMQEARGEERGASEDAVGTTSRRPDDNSDPNPDLQQIISERDTYLDGWKRAKADYENIVREMNQKKLEYADWATEQVLSELLPALDQYDIAMQFAPSIESLPEDQQKVFRNWMVGLEAVRSLWWESAKKLGLERIKAEGKFDPAMHEAVSEEASETIESGNIIRATMSGYLLKGKVIRPAKVVVSK